MNRTLLHVVALAAVVVTAGCSGGLFGGISEEQLCEEQTYDWNTSAAATYNVTTGGEYQAVYEVNGTDTFELYHTDGLGNDQPLQISSVQFVAADGTEYDCEDIDVSESRRRTTVELPAEDGQFAYTSSSTPKRFTTRTFVNGSHEVVLPADREVSNPLFGNVQPQADDVDRSGERLRVRWEEVDAETIVVQYYLKRDVPLFFGLVTVAGLAAVVGIVYYYRLIRGLQRKREEAGLNVDVEDDEFDDGPPPGMG